MERFLGPKEIVGKSASAYERLRGMIVRGEVKPARRLAANELAYHFEVSITPVRDALARLAAEGFVTWEVNRGYFTKPLTVEEQSQLLDANRVLFSACVRMALPRLSEDDYRTMINIVQQASADALPLTHVAAQDALNHLLADASGNEPLANMYKITLDRTHLIRRMDARQQADAGQSAQALRMLGQLMRQGDIDTLVRAVEMVIEGRRSRLQRLVEEANTWATRSHFP